jgi:hypothetical protein
MQWDSLGEVPPPQVELQGGPPLTLVEVESLMERVRVAPEFKNNNDDDMADVVEEDGYESDETRPYDSDTTLPYDPEREGYDPEGSDDPEATLPYFTHPTDQFRE